MDNLTPQKIAIGIAIALVSIVALFGAWKFSSKPIAPEVFSISINEKDHTLGNTKAKVVIVEYSDLQCPACKVYAPVIESVMKKYSDKVLFVYRHFPLQQHKNGRLAAMASEAASKQGKFFEMQKLMFENQADWEKSDKPNDIFVKYAEKLKLDVDQFKKDLTAGDSADKIDADQRTGIEYRITSTPTLFINGVKTDLPGSLEAFDKLIQEELAKQK